MAGIVEHVPVTPIDSPCVNICRILPATGHCEGCARTLAEIAGWSSGTAEWRARVLAALPGRKTPGP